MLTTRAYTAQAPEDYYYHQDDQFSVYALSDDAGVVVERYDYGDYGRRAVYDAAGTERAGGSAYGVRHAFTGQLADPETGFVLYRNRYLWPELGRWVHRDPAGYVDGASLYEYVGSAPLVYTDPHGFGKCGLGQHKMYVDVWLRSQSTGEMTHYKKSGRADKLSRELKRLAEEEGRYIASGSIDAHYNTMEVFGSKGKDGVTSSEFEDCIYMSEGGGLKLEMCESFILAENIARNNGGRDVEITGTSGWNRHQPCSKDRYGLWHGTDITFSGLDYPSVPHPGDDPAGPIRVALPVH